MKKFLKIFFAILGGIFLLLLILPFLFKGKIEAKVKELINEEINATVSWDRFSLSLIRNFPNLGMGLYGLTVTNDYPFEGDTLVHVGSFSVSVDVMSAVRGEAIDIRSVLISKPYINLQVNNDTIANWDIMPEGEDVDIVEEESEAMDFNIRLRSFEIRDATLAFSDASMELATTLSGFDAYMRGDLTQSYTTINIDAVVKAFDLSYADVSYIKNADIELLAKIGADLDNMIFTFEDNEIIFSRIPLFMSGTIAMPEEGFDLDLKLAARETEFKTLLALVPEAFSEYLEGLETEGYLALEATAKGMFIDEDHLPAFNFLFNVKDGQIQYTDLPESIKDIQIHAEINNPGGTMDETVVAIETFHFKLADNPFDADFHVSTPVSNAIFNGSMVGTIDLGSLMDAIPMDSIELRGILQSDLALAGDYNMIENEQYEDIKADGNISLSNFVFRSPDLPMGFIIDKADFLFNPRFLELRTFISRLGETDIALTGRLENYLAYVLKDETIKGSLHHRSSFINVNELMSLMDEPEELDEPEPFGKILIPSNIEFLMSTGIDRILFDKMELSNTAGNLEVKDSKVLLKALGTNLLNGNMLMNGEYNTQDTLKPGVDFDLAINSIDLNKAAHSFSMVDSMLPVAKNASGLVSGSLKFSSVIGDDLSPVLSTMNGVGQVRSQSLEIKGTKAQDALASALRDEKYRSATARDITANFQIENGNLVVEPFDVFVFGKKLNISGTQSLEQDMNFMIRMPVSQKELGNITSLLGGAQLTGDRDVMVGVKITGKPADPKLSFSTEDLKDAVKEEVKKEVEKAIEKGIEKGLEEIIKDEEVKEKIENVGRRLRDLF